MEKLAAHLTAPFLLFFKYWASFFCPHTGKASFLAHPHYLTAWYQSVSHRNFFLCSPLCLTWFLPLLFLSVHSFICKRPREQNNCVEMIYTLKKILTSRPCLQYLFTEPLLLHLKQNVRSLKYASWPVCSDLDNNTFTSSVWFSSTGTLKVSIGRLKKCLRLKREIQVIDRRLILEGLKILLMDNWNFLNEHHIIIYIHTCIHT